MQQFPEHRTGQNSRYELGDAGMAAFSVFFVQSPSFLARQRDMKIRRGRCNAEKLFELRDIPSDNQIRSLLDPIEPTQLGDVYGQTFRALEEAGIVSRFRFYSKQILITLDGTEYFSSRKIHCENCSQRVRQDGGSIIIIVR